MIGRQVKIYLHPEDHSDVDRYIRERLGAALLADQWNSERPQGVVTSCGSGPVVYVCPQGLIGDLRPRFIASQNHWVVDVNADPLIEWRSSKLIEGDLYPGRLYYVPWVVDREGKHTKVAEFTSVADKFFRWMRDYTSWVETDWGREKVGPHAMNLLNRKRICLKMNPPAARRR